MLLLCVNIYTLFYDGVIVGFVESSAKFIQIRAKNLIF
jgi:hypothetical protein